MPPKAGKRKRVVAGNGTPGIAEQQIHLWTSSRGGGPRTIAKSGNSRVEAADSLCWAEGTGLGMERHRHRAGKPPCQAQGVQPSADQGGEYLAQPRTAQRVEVLAPTAVLHVMQAVLNLPVVAE